MLVGQGYGAINLDASSPCLFLSAPNVSTGFALIALASALRPIFAGVGAATVGAGRAYSGLEDGAIGVDSELFALALKGSRGPIADGRTARLFSTADGLIRPALGAEILNCATGPHGPAAHGVAAADGAIGVGAAGRAQNS